MLFLFVLKSVSDHIGIFAGDCCHNQFKHLLIRRKGHIHVLDFLCSFFAKSEVQNLGNAAIKVIDGLERFADSIGLSSVTELTGTLEEW